MCVKVYLFIVGGVVNCFRILESNLEICIIIKIMYFCDLVSLYVFG